MEKEFVPHQESLELKELGFDESCVYYVDKDNNSYIYNFQTHPDEFIEGCGVNVIPTPTFSQAFRWFREKYSLYHDIKMFGDWDKPQFSYIVLGRTMTNPAHMWHYEDKNSYEEAELACLKRLIKIVKDGNK